MIQLKIEREALKKETDAASAERLKQIEVEIQALEKKSADMTAAWQAEKQQLAGAQEIKEKLDQVRIEAEQAQRQGDYQKAGELLHSVIPELTKKLAQADSTEHRRVLNEWWASARSPPSCRAGQVFPSTRCWRASAKSCSIWRRRCASA